MWKLAVTRVALTHSPSRSPFLVVSAAQQLYALPLALVAETMRPLPIRKLEPSVEGVTGVSRIRGHAVPVIDLGNLVSHSSTESSQFPRRFVSMKSGSRTFALAVDSVLGIHELDPAQAQELPALLQVNPNVRATTEIHHELLFYIEPIRLVPEAAWESMKDTAG
jgi:chemotaxis signal transduction protein